ncbi:unnamed protein product [Paramecium octaurelia]|uniref:Cyclic nucleotide-binding domain-containing protein n=1 Tax=Paramecium octaurelia TaxID=43137 RepID=A0A8S1VW85_PAROT|nr:unnamed protein product [Paramecium octaurelia]
MLKEYSKHASDVVQGQDDHIKQRNEKKNKKFVNGILQKDEFVENLEKMEKEKKPHDYQVILNALSQHYFFAHISDQHKEDIVMKMFYCRVAANEFVFQENDQANAYFIFDQGVCDILGMQKSNFLLEKVLGNQHYYMEHLALLQLKQKMSVSFGVLIEGLLELRGRAGLKRI